MGHVTDRQVRPVNARFNKMLRNSLDSASYCKWIYPLLNAKLKADIPPDKQTLRMRRSESMSGEKMHHLFDF